MVAGTVALSPVAAGAATLHEYAVHYAPVLYQDTADGFPDDWRNRRYDLVTRFDFDGNALAADNWASAESWKLPAFVYWEGQETATHVFLVYGFYHPRDWEAAGCFHPLCHENDQENYRLTIAKDGSDFGAPILLDGDSHGFHRAYALASGVSPGRTAIEAAAPSFDGSHVRLFLEAKGHGPQLCAGDSDCRSRLAGGDGVVYRVTADGAPSGLPEPDVEPVAIVEAEYGLLPSFEELWWRVPGDYEQAFDATSAVVYQGGRLSLPFPVPRKWNSDDFGSQGDGHMTWGVEFVSGGADRLLDWGLDPALSVKEHFTIAGEDDPSVYSLDYTCNPYVGVFDSCPERAGVPPASAGGGVAPGVEPVWRAAADDGPRYPGCDVACGAARGMLAALLGLAALAVVPRAGRRSTDTAGQPARRFR